MAKKQKITNKNISEVMSKFAREGHKKNPRPREFYVAMAKKRYEKKTKDLDK